MPRPLLIPLLIPLLWLLTSGFLSLSAAPRTCRILFLGATNDAPRSLELFDGTAARTVELPRMNFSPVYELPAGDITLRLLESVPEKPQDIPDGAPKATVPERISNFYLLVSSDPKNTIVPVSLKIIDANTSGFRNGQLLWFNLTPYHIGGKLGSEKLALEPRSKTITSAPAKGNEDYHVDIYYQMPEQKQAWPLCETKWQHNPAARIVMFVLPEAGSRIPRIMSFTDFRKETEPE